MFSHSNKKAQDWEELEEQEYDWDGAEEGYAGADPYADEEEPEGQWTEESEADGAYYEDEEYAEAPGRRGRSYGYEAWEPEGGEGYGAEEESWEPAGSGEYYAAEEDEEAFADGYGREGSGESFGGFGIEDGYEESHDYYGADELEESDEYYETDSRRRDDYYAEDFRESDDYYGTEGGMEEDVDYYGQEEEGSPGYYRREDAPYASRPVRSGDGKPRNAQKNQPEGFLAAVGRFLRGMDAMDRITVAAGLGVLVLVILTVSVFVKASITDRQVSDFADVGKQLDGITTIGEKGLMAVADAELAKLTASAITPDGGEEEPKPGYEESGYDRQVSVQPSFTSIQKDLKIKFVNKKTDKLVANVPFSVTVTGPDGKSAIWSDDDMDGIIYKKDIAAGTYKVAMESLSDERYASYAISTQQQSVEVKKEISYSKVDVSNEVKQESEVNAKQEDTKKNDVVVESSLQDTVPWVESKVLSASYEEVGKNIIPDPMTLVALSKSFLRMSEILALE